MESIQGFLLINVYAFFVILATCIIFFSKRRLNQTEDKLYQNFILINIFMSLSGLLLGLAVNHDFFHNEFLIKLLNKLYLVNLLMWILLLTYYIIYVSVKKKSKKYNIILNSITIASVFLVIILPITVDISEKGAATSSGASIIFTYTLFAIGFITQIICLFANYKNLKSKKYIPLYLFIFLGSLVLTLQIINPSLNYIINPALIFIAFVMYFTIENPDVKMLEEVHHAKEISDNANEEKTMFLYNMTNDIRSITKEIEASTDNILNEADNKKVNIEYISDNARDIKGSTAKFTTMTNEILDISSIDTANIKIYNDKYNVKLIIKELVQVYKSKAEKKNLAFRTSIASDLPEYLYGDSVGLKSSLDAILDNSVKFTEAGYIELQVNYIMKNDIARLIISVEDSGSGIKAEELDKIFNKKEEDKEYTNLHTNLYNARKLITLMGGTIVPSSSYGKGTTIKVVLDQKVFNDETSQEKYGKYLNKKRILLVDDSDASIKLFTKILNDSNVILESVKLGKECLDRIRNKEKYDLILIDEKMKPISGLELMSKLKDIKSFNIKTILLTRDNDYEYNEDYLKYGFNDYILKPLDKEKVLEKISKYL